MVVQVVYAVGGGGGFHQLHLAVDTLFKKQCDPISRPSIQVKAIALKLQKFNCRPASK